MDNCASHATPTPASKESPMRVTVSRPGHVPTVGIVSDPPDETISPSEVLTPLIPFKNSGVRVELSGHFKLSESLEFDGFLNLQIVGVGNAIIEQKNGYNDASPLVLTKCQYVRVLDLKLL